ncbi:MAG: DUF4215 domain-containing protein [Labilithrix sp.]|nr:DUF4215 domain-containing protein [Labilithrix sp.]
MSMRRPAAVLVSLVGVIVAYGCGGEQPPTGGEFPPEVTLNEGPDPGSGFGPSNPLGPSEAGPSGSGCGNSVKEGAETCDDGNATPGDGCSATCQLEPGWNCPTVGAACVAAGCGDGIVAGDEDCDDGNTTSLDGCSSVCVLEEGFKCPVPNAACVATTCGDKKIEGTEQCDDGNQRPYDGCSPDCKIEPTCAGGTCTAVCGDGVKFPGEQCDDGNRRSGDGCSATCTLEPGFTCQVITSDLPGTIDVPVVYRDFQPTTHPDFQSYCCGLVTGLVKPSLAMDGTPEFLSIGSTQMLTSAADFFDWYHDSARSQVIVSKLTLTKQPDDAYVYDDGAFFPLDGLGYGNEGNSHNYHFTSELRYYFTYKGGEILDFRGDDDVFVFINGKLAVDIGGVHGALPGGVTLDAAKATELGLAVNGMYELDVFQAERHTVDSNYKLTLRGFVKARTECAPICGDGIKTKNEACDDGVNAGGYGKCAPGCVFGPRCGDGQIQAEHGEQCDDGNLVDGDGCSSKCKVDVVVPK